MTALKMLGALFSLLLVCSIPGIFQERNERPGIYLERSMNQDSTVLNDLWKNARNTGDSSLIDFYAPGAVKVVSKDSIWTGPARIYDHYRMQEKINTVSTAFTTHAHLDRGITYEINSYGTIGSQYIIQLVIYEKVGDQKLRVFEFETNVTQSISKQTSQAMGEQIRERREQWMAYCNAHDIPGLINDLYSQNTLYFNHRPLVIGREALVREYSYMNNEHYSLSLHPRNMTLVNDSTVIEIGQCKGSYNGKYILVWKKEDDGQWRIFIDSNV